MPVSQLVEYVFACGCIGSLVASAERCEGRVSPLCDRVHVASVVCSHSPCSSRNRDRDSAKLRLFCLHGCVISGLVFVGGGFWIMRGCCLCFWGLLSQQGLVSR